MLALLLSHWRAVLVALSLLASLVGGFAVGWKLKPAEIPDAELIEVPTRDTAAEQALQAQVAELQKQLADSKSSGHASAHYTTPDGGSFALECESQAQSVQVCEATQVVIQRCDQHIETHEVPSATKPDSLRLWAGGAVSAKPLGGWNPEAGLAAGADLGAFRAALVVTNPIAPKFSPTVTAVVGGQF